MPRFIEWRHDGRKLVIPVVILRPYPVTDLGGLTVSALIDTGSTISGVAAWVARDLALPDRGKRPLGSAQGMGQANRFLFRVGLLTPDETTAPAFPFVFNEVVGIELVDSFSLDALIGMDILRQCDFGMTRNGVCRLAFG